MLQVRLKPDTTYDYDTNREQAYVVSAFRRTPEQETNRGAEDVRHDGGGLGAADRLRSAAARAACARSRNCWRSPQLGALLCFDMNNVRYITATHIGTWAQDKVSRFTLLPQNDEPILWDFGSAARHHQQNCPWLGERSRAGIPSMRGSMTPGNGTRSRRRQEDPHRARGARSPEGAARRRHRRAARHVRAAARRHQRRRRPGADVRLRARSKHRTRSRC